MLTVTVPAAGIRLTTVDAVKADLALTGSADDTMIGNLIDRASVAIASWCNRVLARETVVETFRLDRPLPVLQLTRWPVVTVASITVAGISLAGSAWETELATGMVRHLNNDCPVLWPTGKTVVTYTAGYLLPGETGRTLPADLEAACIAMVRVSWHAKGRDTQLRQVNLGDAQLGYFNADAGMGDGMPSDVLAILDRYRELSVG